MREFLEKLKIEDMSEMNIIKSGSLLLCAALLLGSCGNVRKKEVVKMPVKVRVESVGASKGGDVKTYVGRVESSKSVVVNSPFPAKLEQVNVKQGQKVRKNQQVAKIYSETVASTLNAARATMRQAQDGYDRLQKVKGNGSVPEIKVVEVETALAKARAALNSAQKAAYDCSVKAPFAGTVSEVYCEEGEDIPIAQPLVKIVDLSSLEISISVPETEISSLEIGAEAQVSVPALSETPVRARLVRKGVDASLASHSYECRLALCTPIENLMPGMVSKVVFRPASEGESLPLIPASVIRTDRNGRYVWTVGEDSRVAKTYVVTGEFVGKGVRILSGLSAGDRLIVEGAAKVSTGMQVEAVEE